jgi:hypothetical protein
MTTRATRQRAGDDLRARLLGETWFLTIFAVLLATGLPWFVSALKIDVVRASQGIFFLGVIHVLLSNEAVLRVVSDEWRRHAFAALHAAGVSLLGFIWLHAGGAANPLFLLAFAMPVIGAMFISRLQPYLSAALALVAVFVVMLVQQPEVRWYVSGSGSAAAWLVSFFGVEGARGSSSAPGFDAPLSYFAVLFQVFAVLLFGCAVAADHLGSVFERLRARATAARVEAERGQEMWATFMEHLPVPAFLIDADTLRVICASQRASEIVSAAGSTVERSLFETVRFSYPDIVQNLIEVNGGLASDVTVRVRGELRTAEVSVTHIAYADRRFALVVIHDVTEPACVKLALDMADHAALVVDERGRVKAFNKPALALFSDMRPGTEVADLLSPPGWGTAWWQAGLVRRRKAIAEIRQRNYEVTCGSAALPGEEESLHVVALRPVAKNLSLSGFASASAPSKSVEVER